MNLQMPTQPIPGSHTRRLRTRRIGQNGSTSGISQGEFDDWGEFGDWGAPVDFSDGDWGEFGDWGTPVDFGDGDWGEFGDWGSPPGQDVLDRLAAGREAELSGIAERGLTFPDDGGGGWDFLQSAWSKFLLPVGTAAAQAAIRRGLGDSGGGGQKIFGADGRTIAGARRLANGQIVDRSGRVIPGARMVQSRGGQFGGRPSGGLLSGGAVLPLAIGAVALILLLRR